jgi:SWI/SNF-related matrix-associated actin-dependent regulator of chromatin subfamily A member 5
MHSLHSPNTNIQHPRTLRNTAASLLAKFLPGAKILHKMDSEGRRVRTPVKYTESDASSSRSPPSETSPGQSSADFEQDGLDEDEDEDEDEDNTIQYATPSYARLRERKPNKSLKAMENGYTSRKRPQTTRKKSTVIKLAGRDLTPVVSRRTAIREEIANKTAATRNMFLVEKKDLWLPLLPPNNYVRKLVEKHENLSAAEVAKLPMVSPYEEIETQPRGVNAVMKPYQLSGLSFMVYLYRNGLSGILGDEMGLGKTLQTLSLIQYLKENDPKTGTGRLQRPFLVVCPLSVLSSWIAEARKWTPGLKVIRFHGPRKERNRMKKIVVGEMDMFGNLTAQAKSKLKSRRGADRKTAVSFDTDLEDEANVGVDLVVTTYECYRMENPWFKKAFIWRWAILDEGHAVCYVAFPLCRHLN